MKLVIKWLEDSHDCETCGYSYSYGAKVTLDDVVILDDFEKAHCYGGSDVTPEDILKALCKHLNIEIREIY